MRKEYVITIMLLAVLAACSAPTAMGGTCNPEDVATGPCPCACGTSGAVTGTVHVENGHFGPDGDKTPYADFYVPDGTIKWARVYWTLWGGTANNTGWSNATFCNSNTRWTNNRFINNASCDQNETMGYYKGGCGSHFLYWNVTGKVSNGANNLSVDQSSWSDGRCYEIILVVVLDDGSAQTRYWINQGYDLPDSTYATWFNGTIDNTNHTLYHYAYADDDSWALMFNGSVIANYSGTDYSPMEVVEIGSSHISGSAQKMEWFPWKGNFHPNLAVLVGNADFFHPDLVVEDKKIERFNSSDQVPTDFVVCHIYDVDVLIKNRGGTDASETFNVSLFDDGTRVSNATVTGLAHGTQKWVTLQWHPTTSGTHTLRVMADSDDDVNDESIEANNNKTQYDEVLLNNSTLADLYPRMRVLPAWKSNNATIVVKMYNSGTTDASSFDVHVTNASPLTGTSVYAKAYREVTFNTSALVNCSDYNITVVLDTANTTTESNEGNNSTYKVFHAVDVRLKVTHHYGNTSTYNGVPMIDVAKVIPNCTTPYDLLGSEADIIGGGLPGYVYGINNINESANQDPTCPSGRPIYWYVFVNGIIPGGIMPDPMVDYLLDKPGEVVHMDLLKYVNSGETDPFKPQPIMDFPEPFLHGYNGTRWDTIIAYPTGYSVKANAIRTKLVSYGVSGVSTKLESAMTAGDKSGNNLILLGKPTENNIIAEINANHTKVGMPMYFDASNPNAIRLYDDLLDGCCGSRDSSYHGVIMACDNPFADENESVWIASGVTTWYANDAADMLASGNLGDKGFWYKTRKCGDIDGNGVVANAWDVDAMRSYLLCTSDWASDVNCDGVVANAWDVDALRNYALNCCACP